MSYAIQFLLSYLLWVLLVWPFGSDGWAQDLIAGVLVAGLSAAVFGRVFPRHPAKMLDPLRWLCLLVFIPIFLWDCFLANLDVAYRVLHLRLPIRPAIVKIRTSIRSDMGKFMLANSITLTPGTLTVDVVGQDLYVHWINAVTDSPQLRTELIAGRFESLLKRIFD